MADNITVSAGSGNTLATDETTISGTAAHVQRVTAGAAPTVSVSSVSPTTSATLILAANVERKSLTIKAIDGTVYLGGSGVTTGSGFPIEAGESFSSTTFLGAVYGRTASGTVNVRAWEES